MSPAGTLSNEDANSAVLAAADSLFYANGVEAVTMAELRDAAGVSMRRLYRLFPNKADVVTAWLRDRHDCWTREFTGGVKRRIAAGDRPVVAVFGQLEDWMVSTGFRGCAFINTHAGSNDYTPEQLDVIRTHKRELERHLRGLVPDAPGLNVLVDGAIVQASIHASPDPIRAALALADTRSGP